MIKKIGLFIGLGILAASFNLKNMDTKEVQDNNKIQIVETIEKQDPGATKKESSSMETKKEKLIYRIWNRADDIIVVEFSNGAWLKIDEYNNEYKYYDTEEIEYNYNDFTYFENDIKDIFKNYELVEESYLNPSKLDEELNPNNYTQVNYELEKLPSKIKQLLIDNNIFITYGFLEVEDDNIIHGRYLWDDNTVIMNKDDGSICYAFIHEVGHALDDILKLEENEELIKAYEEKEIYFDNEHFYLDVNEYIAQSIQEYFDGTLDNSTRTYKVINEIIKNI